MGEFVVLVGLVESIPILMSPFFMFCLHRLDLFSLARHGRFQGL